MAVRLRIFAAVAASLVLATLGCESKSQPSSPGETITSETLRAEFDSVLTEMTASAASDPQKAAAASRLVSEVMMRTPGMFQVSSTDEARFKRDEFNDAANRARILEAGRIIKAKGRPPQLTQYLFERDRKKPLTGVRLELLAHLAERNAKVLSTG